MSFHFSVGYRQFKNAYKGTYGAWRSSQMVEASRALKAYESDPSQANANRLTTAWYAWLDKKRTEFNRVDRGTAGLARKLAIEMDVVPGFREGTGNAIELKGNPRENPVGRQAPKVVVHDKGVTELLATLGARRVGVMLIDAYGDQNAAGFHCTYGRDEVSVMDNVKAVLGYAKDKGLPVINVYMKNCATWKELTDLFPPRATTLVKPYHGVFDRSGFEVEVAEANLQDVVVMGFDANVCVAESIFGADAVAAIKRPYQPGLLDLGYNVITSRTLVGSGNKPLSSVNGWPYMGPAN